MKNKKINKTTTEKPKVEKKKKKHIGKTLWVVFQVLFILVLMGGLFTGGVAAGFFASHVVDEPLRGYEEISSKLYDYNQTGEIYSSDGSFIGNIRTAEVSQPITLNEVSPNLTNAILATEDHIFFEHEGINIRAISRAVLEYFMPTQGSGGSTITQQLVKNQILDPTVSFERKFKEWLLAMRVEQMFPKEQILEAYMNIMYLGYNANGQNIEGVRAAAEGLFGVDVGDLNLPQSAYIAGMIQSPGRYTPFNRTLGANDTRINDDRIKNGEARMRFVLSRMLETNFITQEQYEEALTYDIKSNLTEPTPSARENYPFLSAEIEQRAINIMLENMLEEQGITTEELEPGELSDYRNHAFRELSRGGYKIYTTIDLELYEAFHEVVAEHEFGPEQTFTETIIETDPETGEEVQTKIELPYLEQTGVTLLDNQTGAILSMIEGRDFERFEGNLTTRPRQPGSSIKPLLQYGPAMELGLLQPASILDDAPLFISDPSLEDGYWVPRNVTNRFKGLVTVRDALIHSDNLPAIKTFLKLQQEAGRELPFDYLKKMGISTLANEAEITRGAVAIGGFTHGLTIEENTNAYATFANNGTFVEAYMIDRIETLDGETFFQHQTRPEQVFSEQTAFLMNDVLVTAVTQGTGSRVRDQMGSNIQIAGKTGTTNDRFDYWFIGYTPQVSMGVWLGYEKNIRLADGYNQRNQVLWSNLMKKLIEMRPEYVEPTAKFEQPDGIVRRTVCSKSGLLPSEACKEAGYLVTDYFNRNFVPTQVDNTVAEGRVIYIDDDPYIAHDSTPDDFVVKQTFVKREPLNIPEQYKNERSRFLPADWDDTAPTELDPREDNGRDPDIPSELRASRSGGNVNLAWNANEENDIVGYRIYRAARGAEFEHIASIPVHSDNSYRDSDANRNSTYAYFITAVDVAGRESEPSEFVTSNDSNPDLFFTPEATQPRGVRGRLVGNTLELDWNANPEEEQIEHYILYISEQSASEGFRELTKITEHSHSFTLPSNAKEQWYYLTAVNVIGESGSSRVIKVTLPSSAPTPTPEPTPTPDPGDDDDDEEPTPTDPLGDLFS